MPEVKKLFQKSENSAKPAFIHGHMFGGLGVLAGSICNWACISLSIWLHDGLQAAKEWKGASASSVSHVVQMVEGAYHAALTFGDSLLLLDRYFLTVPALKKLKDFAWRSSPRPKSHALHMKSLARENLGGDGHAKKGAAIHLKRTVHFP